jgi:hypothetical protein
MNLILPWLLAGCFIQSCMSQPGPESQVKNIIARQVTQWNQGNITGFMETYWHSDSLIFIGKSGITRGWEATIRRYQKAYPGKAGMGTLSLDIDQLKVLSPEYAFLTGRWMVIRSSGTLQGYFSLLLRNIHGKWLIIADHSS